MVESYKPVERGSRSASSILRQVFGKRYIEPDGDELTECTSGVTSADAPFETVISSISEEGIALIKRFEGCAQLREDGLIKAYPDPATGGAPWTIGWGATGHGIGPESVWTQSECDERLVRDLVRYSSEVERALVGAPVTQNQFDALVSFHYNTGAIARATLTRKHRAGDYLGAFREFGRWNRAAGRVLSGLTRRRAAEAALYRRDSPN